MIHLPGKGLAACLMCCALANAGFAQETTNVLPAETQLVATGRRAARQQSFTIATPEDLVVTLTDLQLPAALQAAGVVITQAGAIAGSAQLASPATTATVSLRRRAATTRCMFSASRARRSMSARSRRAWRRGPAPRTASRTPRCPGTSRCRHRRRVRPYRPSTPPSTSSRRAPTRSISPICSFPWRLRPNRASRCFRGRRPFKRASRRAASSP